MDGRRKGGVVMKDMRRGFRRIVVTSLLGLAGCTTILGIPDSDDLEPILGIGGSTASASIGTGGTGGVGGTDGCVQAFECPHPANECIMATCMKGTCGMANVAENTPTSSQTDDDCLINVCDGNGQEITKLDNADPKDDMKECTNDVCVEGLTQHIPIMAGTPCRQNGGSVCNDVGDCIECTMNMECLSNSCVDGFCEPISWSSSAGGGSM